MLKYKNNFKLMRGSSFIKKQAFFIPVVILLSDALCIIDAKYKLLHSFMTKYYISKEWNIFLKFLGKVTSLVLQNNLRKILGLKSEKFKKIKAPRKVGCSYINIRFVKSLLVLQNFSTARNVAAFSYCTKVL